MKTLFTNVNGIQMAEICQDIWRRDIVRLEFTDGMSVMLVLNPEDLIKLEAGTVPEHLREYTAGFLPPDQRQAVYDWQPVVEAVSDES